MDENIKTGIENEIAQLEQKLEEQSQRLLNLETTINDLNSKYSKFIDKKEERYSFFIVITAFVFLLVQVISL